MATRATYNFHNTQLTNSATVYIHQDGYPEGAACYIAGAIDNKGGITVERFIRVNEDAEVTSSHEAHGDTNYRYDFHRAGEMSVMKHTIELVGDSYQENWSLIFDGTITDFIGEYRLQGGAQ